MFTKSNQKNSHKSITHKYSIGEVVRIKSREELNYKRRLTMKLNGKLVKIIGINGSRTYKVKRLDRLSFEDYDIVFNWEIDDRRNKVIGVLNEI